MENGAIERDTVKQEKGHGKRQVLGDIGNLDEFRINVGRPITRSFHAKLLSNAQATTNPVLPLQAPANDQGAAEGNKKVAAPAIDNETIVHKKNKKRCEENWSHEANLEPLDVAGSEAEAKVNVVSKRECRERSSKKLKILASKGKASLGILRNSNNNPMDIDRHDANNDLAAVDYLDELYKFYKIIEVDFQVSDYMKPHRKVHEKVRSIVVDWLVDVHMEFKLVAETLYLTINIIDRYLSLIDVKRSQLQLVAICSMLIACKYEEVLSPKVSDFLYISDDAYTKNQFLSMERDIIDKLQWRLTAPTTYVFLVRLIRANVVQDKEMENLAFYLAELGILDYKVIILYSPSMIAAGAIYSARCTLRRSPLWSATLQKLAGYCKEQIIDCVKSLVSLHASAGHGELRSVYSKFLSQKRGYVALLSPPKHIV